MKSEYKLDTNNIDHTIPHQTRLERGMIGPASPDMEFVKKFTPQDFQAKSFTPSISPNFNSFSKEKHKK